MRGATSRFARTAASALALAAAAPLSAEPIFLSRQYARCTNCHYSPTGGGQLTPYGRALSRVELSTFGVPSGSEAVGREHEFLFGLLGDTPGKVSLGIDLRPAHLDVREERFSGTRSFLMNADLTAAARFGHWTFYAQVGRQPRRDDTEVTSFEHWISYQSRGGRLGARAGRFLPAYGVRFADHTTFNRATVGLDNDAQVYGLELSFNGARHLVQLQAGPGRASDVGDGDLRAFTASGRWQFDLRPRIALVASGLYRTASGVDPGNGAAGLALGVAPHSRLTLWAQGDVRFRGGDSDARAYTLVGEAAFEAYRGVWLRFSPQLRTELGDASDGTLRLNLAANLLPRTHWNVVVSWYHDQSRRTREWSRTLLLQLHLYL